MRGVWAGVQLQLPFPRECQRGCRCPGCAPAEWGDPFRWSAAMAKVAELTAGTSF